MQLVNATKRHYFLKKINIFELANYFFEDRELINFRELRMI